MKKVIAEQFESKTKKLDEIIENFDSQGKDFGQQDRNTLKLFELDDDTINVKSFKVPNFINQFAYRFFRKSKAQRSFEYANKLMKLGIGTPQPIAYYEYTTPFLFKNSFYISKQLDVDLTYRELTLDLNFPEHEQILRAFTRFTYFLHEKGVNFLDHSPGNTLIRKKGDSYEFFLVDLNRMEFKNLSLKERIENFRRLTTHKSMVEVMSDEYAKCSGTDKDKIFELMWLATEDFQKAYHRRRNLKKKLKFWKN
ncbi:lipopolysaccharide kinase InaA family protein [Winogradskyella alexanderae]|uniref:Lipopolysaccharide kinase InaA family protein n=1 Tax=Winogradskyella alexanderae TaxID=2877123 RepID=A0ABS7XQ18_9FLAO|nr:lipopolysaccharide kinase InaA family protein [Winogradskyella alexanderae]MCA0132095.1 lipopolysaccharide kinase InaA family protein [Winogradskyella alexanderae]